jgi:hypothetical protein
MFENEKDTGKFLCLIPGQHHIIRQELSARDFASEKGSFSQAYFVYVKKK